MAEYITNLAANSPLLSYSPSVGTNPSTGWVETPLIPYEVAYWTSAPKASVSFDFYGDQFELSGFLAPLAAEGDVPNCGFNVTLNGELQYPSSYYSPYNIPLDQYHVELSVSCPEEGQEFGFTGPAFVETQGSGEDLYSSPGFLPADKIDTLGQWKKEKFYSGYYAENFTEFISSSFGSSLAYTFKGVSTSIIGSVGPKGASYVATIDGTPSKVFTTYNTAEADSIVLWFAEFLKNDTEHVVTFTNLGTSGQTLTVQGATVTTIQAASE